MQSHLVCRNLNRQWVSEIEWEKLVCCLQFCCCNFPVACNRIFSISVCLFLFIFFFFLLIPSLSRSSTFSHCSGLIPSLYIIHLQHVESVDFFCCCWTCWMCHLLFTTQLVCDRVCATVFCTGGLNERMNEIKQDKRTVIASFIKIDSIRSILSTFSIHSNLRSHRKWFGTIKNMNEASTVAKRYDCLMSIGKFNSTKHCIQFAEPRFCINRAASISIEMNVNSTQLLQCMCVLLSGISLNTCDHHAKYVRRQMYMFTTFPLLRFNTSIGFPITIYCRCFWMAR